MPGFLALRLESPHWVRFLRWVAIVGMAASLAGASLIGVDVRPHLVWPAIGFLALLNLLFPRIEDWFVSTEAYFLFQLVVDLFVLSWVLWFTGGLVNPFVGFYLFHVLLAGLLLGRNSTALVALLTGGFVVLLVGAPPFRIHGHEVRLRDQILWMGAPMGLLLLILITTVFVFNFMRRLREVEQQLSQKRKMDALGTLVGGLAHELGTPLNSILLLADAAQVGQQEAVRGKLQVIASQAKRCGDLVALLLGYSSGMAASQAKPVHWETMIRHCFEAIKGSSSVVLYVEVAPGIETSLVPELPVRQALENLLRNAVQASQGRPLAGVRVQVELDPETDEFEISVQDNGPGFSEEAREHAFEAFFTTKGKDRQGTGLGLYVVYHMINQIGGRVSISDTMEQGAKIVVRVPADDSKRANR